MTDTEIANALHALGLGRHNYKAIALLPLFEVAWADGRVQKAERKLIRRVASRYGLGPDDPWLDRWIASRPSPATALAGRQVLLALMARGGARWEVPETLDALVAMCLGVAEAAGGLLGLAFTVERSERDAIEEIAASLSLGPALPPEVVKAWNTARRAQLRRPSPISELQTAVRTVPRVPRSRAGKKGHDEVPLEPWIADDPTAGRSVEAAVEAVVAGQAPGQRSLSDSPSLPDRRERPPGRSPVPPVPPLPALTGEDDTTAPFFDGRGARGTAFVLDDDATDV